MEKYEVLNQIGDGTFGSVAKAVVKSTGQFVAIKKMKQKYYTWDECMRLPEVETVRRIHGHPNIVTLREVIRENNELFLVCEFMDGDLLGVIKKAKQAQKPEEVGVVPAISIPSLKSYMHQILQALAHMHTNRCFHRDLKPENVLVKRDESTGEEVVKLADFGLVKKTRDRPPYTDYVSTRWYRSPELLLQDRMYSLPVDIWAAGCIMAELVTTKPLFPGSNEVDQLFRIMSVLGSPTEKTWPGGIQLGRKIRYTFPSIQGCGLSSVMPKQLPAQALDLIAQMLAYDPARRPTAQQCLQHPFFSVGIDESNGPSAIALQQLATASKRLQQLKQQQPSPQSAPAAFGVGASQGDKTPNDVALPPTADKNKDKGKRQGDYSASPSAASAQKFYIISPSNKNLSSAAQPPPLGPKAAFAPQNLDASPDMRAGSFVQEPSGVSSDSSPAPKPVDNRKGVHLANLRSNGLKSFAPGAVATHRPSLDANAERSTKETTERSFSGYPSATPEAGGGGVGVHKGKAPMVKSLSLSTVTQEAAKGSAKRGSKAEVDLNALLEELATAGLSTQKRDPVVTGGGVGASGNGDTSTARRHSFTKQPDSVTALLRNSRYRANVYNNSAGSSIISLNNSQKDAATDTKKGTNGTKDNTSSSPSAATHAVTPSIETLLAKYRKRGYA